MGPVYPSGDDSRYVISFIVVIKNRSEASKCLVKYHQTATALFPNNHIVELRCDNALEYVKGDLQKFCSSAGITTDSGQPYCPQLNAKAERYNRTLTEEMRSLLLDSKLPKSKWPEAATAAANLINRLPTKSNINLSTPYELWHNRKPTVKYLKVFGCVSYVHIPKETRQRTTNDQKFESRARKTIHLGISGNTGYVFYDPNTNQTLNSRDVVFVESKNYRHFQIERESEVKSISAEHDYATALAVNIDSNCIPETYEEATNSYFAEIWTMAIN